ncbi:3-oxoacyl-[acyl-carrier-protein] reductase FabG-like [Littorina saxatilis]|uniref:Uncharacterized protein n=1 Tax=Littorina saxatilis TaxID=31220 RepID=A0AAN9BP42_9CAEN
MAGGRERSGRLDGEIALITGASSGIGRGTALKFASLGATVVLTGRNASELQATGRRCEKISGEKPLLITADLSKEEDVKRVVDELTNAFHKLDILVNNAGIYKADSLQTFSLQRFDEIFSINVRAVSQLTALCTPALIASKGSIVNVSSLNGTNAFADDLTYCMSKAALDMFTRCTALELAPKQVRVNSVNPGVIKTDIFQRSGMDRDQCKQFLEGSKKKHALGRVGDVEEVADVIAFLASDSASFITGSCIPIDGGRHTMSV